MHHWFSVLFGTDKFLGSNNCLRECEVFFENVFSTRRVKFISQWTYKLTENIYIYIFACVHFTYIQIERYPGCEWRTEHIQPDIWVVYKMCMYDTFSMLYYAGSIMAVRLFGLYKMQMIQMNVTFFVNRFHAINCIHVRKTI